MQKGFILMENESFLKRNWKNLLIIVLFIIATISTCNCGRAVKNCGTISTDTFTVHTRDTQWLAQDTIRIPTTQPIAKTITHASKAKIASILKNIKDDSSVCDKLVEQYYSTKEYNNDIQLLDSTGKNVGTLNLQEKVTENTIKDRDIKYQLKFPIITDVTTTTITKTLTPKAKNHYYIGAEILGNQDDIVNGASIKLLMQNKKSAMFGISIGTQSYNNITKPEFGVQFYRRL